MVRWANEEQIELLRAALFSGSAAQEAWKKWAERVDFDKIDFASQALLPLVSQNSALDPLQSPLFDKCKGTYRRTWVVNHLRWKKMAPLLAELQQAGVGQIALLKGMAMILHYYQDFGVRMIGDIDILIKREDLPLIGRLLQTRGWKHDVPRFDLANSEHLLVHALGFFDPEGKEMDVHWSMLEDYSPELDRIVLEDALRIKDTGLYVPNPTDLLLHTCAHGIKHSPVPSIRWIADAMTLLKHPIDWERLIASAKKAYISIPLSLSLQFLAERFSASIPPSAIRQLEAHPKLWLERIEYGCRARGRVILANWPRYCLSRGYLTLGSQLFHLPKYLKNRARLKSIWHIPLYGIYWAVSRTMRKLVRKLFVR